MTKISEDYSQTSCKRSYICKVTKISKNDLVQTAKKSDKNNLRITAKAHAHFQNLTETHAKFLTDPAKNAGGVAFSQDTQCLYALVKGEPKMTKSKLQNKRQTRNCVYEALCS